MSVAGGSLADEQDFPFAVALVMSNQSAVGGQFCGGTVVSPRHIVTAAHCVDGSGAAEIDVVGGRTRLSATDRGWRAPVESLSVNRRYNADTQRNDIAVLRLPGDVPAPALPWAAPSDAVLAAPGAGVLVAGWGLVTAGFNPDDLMAAALRVRSGRVCADAFGGGYDDRRMICAGNGGEPDSCAGDSGGPLVGSNSAVGQRLVGVVSYGTDEGCGRTTAPGVYTRVSSQATWLADQVNGTAPPEEPPDTGEVDPRLTIGRIACGTKRCSVDVMAAGPGAAEVAGVDVRVHRKRSRKRKAISRRASAKRLTTTKWRARINLPVGDVTLSARALDSNGGRVGAPERILLTVSAG